METPAICRRCGAELPLGGGSGCYLIRIEAFADPSPPIISEADFNRDTRQTMRDLQEQLSSFSEQELLDMVYRKMAFYLCSPCYRRWIEDPTG